MLELIGYLIFPIAFYLKRFLRGLIVAGPVSGEVAGCTPVGGVVKLFKIILRDGSSFVERVFQEAAEESPLDAAQRVQFVLNPRNIFLLCLGGFQLIQFCLHGGDAGCDIRIGGTVFLCYQVGAERGFPVPVRLIELRQRLVCNCEVRFCSQDSLGKFAFNSGFHLRQFRLPLLHGCIAFSCAVCFCLMEAVLVFVVHRVGFALLKLPFLQCFV